MDLLWWPFLILRALAWLAFSSGWAYVVGKRILVRIEFPSRAEEFACCAALGLGTFAHLLFLIGVFGWLSRPVIALLLLGGIAFAWPVWSPWLRWRPTLRWPLGARTTLLLAAIMAPICVLPLYPPSAWDFDATTYHLSLARIHAAAHHIRPVPHIRFPVFPQLNEVLFSSALLLYQDIGAHLLEFLMMLLVALVLFGWGRRWSSALETRRAGWAFVWGYALAALAAGAPWYLFALHHTGNPAPPFFASIFGHSYFSPADLQRFQQELASYGTGRSLRSLLSLPWNLLVQPARFESPAWLTPAYLLLLPAALWAARREVRLRWLFALGMAHLVFWFVTYQVVRYLLPSLPLLSLACAIGLDRLLRRSSRVGSALQLNGAWAIGVGALLLAPGNEPALARLSDRPPPASAAAREAYFAREFSAYPALRWLNQTRGRGYVVYGLYTENLSYFADGKLLGDWFGASRYDRVMDKFSDSKRLHAELRAMGAEYLLCADYIRPVTLANDAFFHEHFTPVFGGQGVRLYQLR